MAEDVYIIGTAMTKFGKYLDKGVKALTGEALELVLKDCGLERRDIEAAWFSNSGWGYHSFQHAVRGQVALSANGLEGIPIVNVENACASGSTALHSAWAAIKAGIYDCVLAIGAEKMYDNDKAKTMMMFMSGSDVEELPSFMAKFQEEERQRKEKGGAGEGPRASQGKHRRSLGLHGPLLHRRPHAHGASTGPPSGSSPALPQRPTTTPCTTPMPSITFPMTVEEVLADREVSYPLTRAMCAPVGDGAAAVVLCSERFLKKRGPGRAIRIRASVLRSGTRDRRERHLREGLQGRL